MNQTTCSYPSLQRSPCFIFALAFRLMVSTFVTWLFSNIFRTEEILPLCHGYSLRSFLMIINGVRQARAMLAFIWHSESAFVLYLPGWFQ